MPNDINDNIDPDLNYHDFMNTIQSDYVTIDETISIFNDKDKIKIKIKNLLIQKHTVMDQANIKL